MEKLSAYNIAFKGLEEGIYIFNYHIDNTFFEHFENSLVDKANLDVQVTLEKQSSFMVLELNLKGTVTLTCDRCLDLYNQPVHNNARLIIESGNAGSVDADDVIWLHPEDYQVNVAQIIYEYIILSVPLKHVHPSEKGGKNSCNPEMLKKLKEYSPVHDKKTDVRWEQLKKFLNN